MLPAVCTAVGQLAFSDLPVWGSMLGGFVGGALRVRRKHVEDAMDRAGIARSFAETMYTSLGTSALELLWLAARPRDLPITLTPRARERLREGGFVLAASHTGNWDMAACAVAQHVPLMIVTKRLSLGWIDRFWQAARASYGIKLVFASGAIKVAARHLASGGVVAMMIDQVPQQRRHAVELPFLGANAFVDKSPAVVAQRCGVPLVVGTAHRVEHGQVLDIRDEIDARAAGAEEATRRATDALDHFVRMHPSDWLWMHRRWKAPS